MKPKVVDLIGTTIWIVALFCAATGGVWLGAKFANDCIDAQPISAPVEWVDPSEPVEDLDL